MKFSALPGAPAGRAGPEAVRRDACPRSAVLPCGPPLSLPGGKRAGSAKRRPAVRRPRLRRTGARPSLPPVDSGARLLERTGLGATELDVLLFLANNPGYDTARDISEMRSLVKSQVSRAVETLARRGLLLRTPDGGDRRIVHLSVTEAGLPAVREGQALQEKAALALTDGLGDAELKQLGDLLGTVFGNAEKLAGGEEQG